MRTIKFRGKDIETGEWIYGDLIQRMGYMPSIMYPYESNGKVRYGECAVKRETVGQFTGLLDKNGKEIYEGDIIGCHNPNIKHLIFYNEKQGRFMAALNGDIDNDFVGVCGLDDSRWNASKEVIGNIHDNPELLKGGAE